MVFRMVKNLDRSFFHFVTVHAFDRRTDGRTEFSLLDRVCIPCSAVKKDRGKTHLPTVVGRPNNNIHI